jgi:non-ribosomal peptide synthase protein (TIGR01720 family)
VASQQPLNPELSVVTSSRHPRPRLSDSYVAPINDVEARLAEIWQQQLGIESVGTHDNFFDLGGDSILSLRIVSEANKIGLHITAKQFLECPTIAKLAAIVSRQVPSAGERILATGPVPLTPVQAWFFEEEWYPHYGNATLLFEVKRSLDPDLFEQAFRWLIIEHDALRLRFHETANGWQQSIVSPEKDLPFTKFDLSMLPEEKQAAEIDTRATRLQASLNLSDGPLFQIAWFDLGRSTHARLLIIIHHLLVDGSALAILMEDLQTFVTQLSKGDTLVSTARRSSSWRQWTERLKAYAQSPELDQELDYWLAPQRRAVSPLPVDLAQTSEANLVGSAETLLLSLNSNETEALRSRLPGAFGCSIEDLLLTALGHTFSRWTERPLLVDLSHHGREELFEDVDVTRTVGWIAYFVPVLLDLGGSNDLTESLRAIQRNLAEIPNRGLGYGLLRYLRDDGEIKRQMMSLPKSQVFFNYGGQSVAPLADLIFTPASESYGPRRDARDIRSHLFEINGGIVDGRLELFWTYSRNYHYRPTIDRLMTGYVEALQNLIAGCPMSQLHGESEKVGKAS